MVSIALRFIPTLIDEMERIKKAQYYNILTYCWEQMSKDKDEKTFLVCDEAWIMIDKAVPQSLIFLRNIAKRCRKYNRRNTELYRILLLIF